MDTPMKQFEPIDPLTIKSDSRTVGHVVDENKPNRAIYVLIDDSYALLAVCNYFTNLRTKESEWLTYPLEFTKAGRRWIVDTFTIKFVKSSEEGGLAGGVYHYEEVVDGEELGISRDMGLGTNENRQSGYTFLTLSRKEDDIDYPKRLSFTDTFLFDRGFLKLIEDTAKRIENCEL